MELKLGHNNRGIKYLHLFYSEQFIFLPVKVGPLIPYSCMGEGYKGVKPFTEVAMAREPFYFGTL